MRLRVTIVLLASTAAPLAQSEQPATDPPGALPREQATRDIGGEQPLAQGVFGYLSRVAADSPLPPYTIVEISHAAASPATGVPEAAWTVVVAAHPVGIECADASDESTGEPCAAFILARDGRVLSGRWHGAQPYAFLTNSMHADLIVTDGWLRGTLRTVDDSQFTPDSAVVNVQLQVPCPDCGKTGTGKTGTEEVNR